MVIYMEETMELKGLVIESNTASGEPDTQKGKYMTFKSGNEYFGLKIQYVNEIIQFRRSRRFRRRRITSRGLSI